MTCKACKLDHPQMENCGVARRRLANEPVTLTVTPVTSKCNAVTVVTPCPDCIAKDVLIAAQKLEIERYSERNTVTTDVTPVTPAVTRSNADRQRDYRERKKILN